MSAYRESLKRDISDRMLIVDRNGHALARHIAAFINDARAI